MSRVSWTGSYAACNAKGKRQDATPEIQGL
jgi:hypothetical protein